MIAITCVTLLYQLNNLYNMFINKYLLISKSLEFSQEVIKVLEKAPFLNNINIATNIEEAISKASDFVPGIILIDISTFNLMEAQTIFDIVNPYISIVLVSNECYHAVEAYKLGIASDFILRPVSLERLMTATNRALNMSYSYSGLTNINFSFLKIGHSYKKFFHDEIVFIEAYGAYIKLYTEKGKFIINDSISKIEKKLSNFNFVRVHKSYIINTQKIISFTSSNFEMSLGKIPIGPNFKQQLRGFFTMLSKAYSADT